jgi:hypothetical protein
VDAFRDVSPPPPKPAPSKLLRTSRPRQPKLFTDVLGEWPLRSVPRRRPEAPRESEAPERTPFAPLAQGGRRASSSPLVKGTIGVAAVLIVAFFMMRGDSSSSYANVATDSGEVATATAVARGTGNGDDGASAANPGTGAFTAGERARVWSALAAVAARRTNLAARLDTLDDALLAARDGGDRTVPCARAAALYQSAVADRAKIDAARRELAQLVGPMRMAGVDSLADRTTAASRSIAGSCR